MNKPKMIYRYQVREDGDSYIKNEPKTYQKEFQKYGDYIEWSSSQSGHPFLYIQSVSRKYLDANGYIISSSRFKQLTES